MLNYTELNKILQDPDKGLDLDLMLECSLAAIKGKSGSPKKQSNFKGVVSSGMQ